MIHGNITHGHASRDGKSKTYKSWTSMKERCYSEGNIEYPRYGGRGILVCEAWKHSFEAFLNDMGERPEGKSLDRIDVEKGYEPGNCKWSTPKEQANNRRVFSTNKTGTTGVRWSKQRNKFYAKITVGGKPVHLGVFDTLEAAVAARKQAEDDYDLSC